MNIRKCPKCGGCVPEGNANCNHCGHKMFTFGGNGLYVGSSKNANKLDSKENPFSDGKNNKGCLIWIIIIFMIGPVFIRSLSVIYDEFKKEGIDFGDLFDDFYMEEDFDVDMDEDDFDMNIYSCANYCGSVDFEEGPSYCFCSNGDIYDKVGKKYQTGTGDNEADTNHRCSLICEESAVNIDNVCYCKGGLRYDLHGYSISDDNEYAVRNIMRYIDEGKKIFIYGPGSQKEEGFLNPVELVEFMKDYDLNVYYLDFDSLVGTVRNELRSDYGIVNSDKPFYYIFENGQLVYYDIFVNNKEQLKVSLDFYLNISSQ